MKIKADTIIRTAILILVLINQSAASLGVCAPIGLGKAYETISAVLTVIISVWCWWKNNSITSEAISADNYLKLLSGKNDKPLCGIASSGSQNRCIDADCQNPECMNCSSRKQRPDSAFELSSQSKFIDDSLANNQAAMCSSSDSYAEL